MFLLTLPTLASMLIVIFASTVFSVALYFIVHPFWSREMTEDTKKVADNISIRIGVVYSIVIGMMLANVRIEHIQMLQALESEASVLSRLYHAIERTRGTEGEEIRREIVDYIRFIVDEQWPALREARPQDNEKKFGGRIHLERLWDYAIRGQSRKRDTNLPKLLDELEHYRTLRLFDTKGNLLPTFWYIAFIGYIASLAPLFIHAPTLRRCVLITLYSGLVSVVLLGIFILSHPYSPAAGVEPDILKRLLEAESTREVGN